MTRRMVEPTVAAAEPAAPLVRLERGRTSVRLEPWMIKALEARARALADAVEEQGGPPQAVNFSAAVRDALAAELRRGLPDMAHRNGYAGGFLKGLAGSKKQLGIALAGLGAAEPAEPEKDDEVEL